MRGARVYASVTRDEKQHKLFVKVVNATSETQPLAINLEGAGKVLRAGEADHAERQDAECHQQHYLSRRGVPVERRVAVAGPKFKESFAPYSINVLELSY